MALAAASAAALPGLAFSDDAVSGGQVVGGVVEAQFGVGVSADGSVNTSASTIPVSVTRTTENGVEVVTIVPLR